MGDTFPAGVGWESDMPWRQATVKDRREEFVALARLEGSNVSELCRRFEISRKTGYKWLGRSEQPGADLADASRRPKTSPLITPQRPQEAVVQVRREHPAWGARKIAHVLGRHQQIELATSTVNSILKRRGLIGAQASQAAQPWHRFEHDKPNSLWQMDFKGHFPIDTGRCHPLTVLDDHSRFSLVLHAQDNER